MPRFEATMWGGNPDYKLVLYTSNSGTTVYMSLYWMRVGSSSYTSFSGGAMVQVVIGGVSVVYNGYNFNAPAGGPIGETLITHGQRDVGPVGSTLVQAYFSSDTTAAGYGEVSGWQSVATVPQAPTPVAGTPDQATATSLRYQFSGNWDGGAPIIRWEYQVSTDPSFAGAPLYTSPGTSIVSSLTPSTTYYFRSRGVNAVGDGPWSAVSSGSTTAASAPSLTVTASISGTSATVAPIAHSSLPSPSGWRLERRVQGTTAPVIVTDFPTPTFTATDLLQGVVYEWRVAALSGSYVSPFSAWVPVMQPNPNTGAGDFYDGSTPSGSGVTYSWEGTPGKSISRATSKTSLGWAVNTGTTGGDAFPMRQIGGRSGEYALRCTIRGGSTTGGLILIQSGGTYRAEVAEGGVYTASAYVQVSRSQQMMIGIRWENAAGAAPGSNSQLATFVTGGTGEWTLLEITATAPVGATHARIYVGDHGTGAWTAWRAGDYFVIDDVMFSLGRFPYLDGDTPDTATYEYVWEGEPHNSTSYRIAKDVSAVDPLADPDCPAPPLPPRPPMIEDDCIEEVTLWRRYWAVIPRQEVSIWLESIPTVRLTTGAFATRQARIRIYENPDELSPELFDGDDSWVSEQVVSFIPSHSTFLIDGIMERSRASTDGVNFYPADHLVLGSDGGPATWPVLSCGLAYLMSVDVPLDSPDGNLSVEVSLTKRS